MDVSISNIENGAVLFKIDGDGEMIVFPGFFSMELISNKYFTATDGNLIVKCAKDDITSVYGDSPESGGVDLLNQIMAGMRTAPHDNILFKIGDGGALTPIAGTTDYDDETMVGANALNCVVALNGTGSLVPGVDFDFKVTGGFTLLTTVFANDQVYTSWFK